MARQFVLLRITNMRGVELDVFDFDFDLTWAALFLRPDGTTLGRYGSRDADSHGKQLSVEGLSYAMRMALENFRHSAGPSPFSNHGLKPALRTEFKTVEDYPAEKRLSTKACIHCHNVYEYRREFKEAAGMWKKDDVWVYPEPENIGLTLDVLQGNRVINVAIPSSAHKAGLRRGDVLSTLNGDRIASIADARYALHQAPAQGKISVRWQRHGRSLEAELDLVEGWRATDISWRWSLKSLQPASGLHGEDLTATEKQRLGLNPQRLAFRQGNFLTKNARQAGIQINDIILGVDGKELQMNAKQFDVFVRRNYNVRDTVTVDLIRGERRMELRMKLGG